MTPLFPSREAPPDLPDRPFAIRAAVLAGFALLVIAWFASVERVPGVRFSPVYCTLYYFLALAYIWRGSSTARFVYIAVDLLRMGYPFTLNRPVADLPWHDVLFLSGSILIWFALCHGTSRRWFREVKNTQLSASSAHQLSGVRSRLAWAMAWGLAAALSVWYLYRMNELGAIFFAALLLPVVVASMVIAVAQSIRIYLLWAKRPR